MLSPPQSSIDTADCARKSCFPESLLNEVWKEIHTNLIICKETQIAIASGCEAATAHEPEENTAQKNLIIVRHMLTEWIWRWRSEEDTTRGIESV